MKKFGFLFSVFCLLVLQSSAQKAGQAYPVWPDGNPDSKATMMVIPAEGENTGIAVLICPGGGYVRLSDASMYFEGMAFAAWLAERGVTGVVLRYTLPEGRSELPIADARQAMKLIRERGPGEWGVDPAKVGVMGFSAGGHLATTLLTKYDAGSRPDFGVLFYPVITFDDAFVHAGSRRWLLGENAGRKLHEEWSAEKNVTAQTPPTLLFHSSDDPTVPVENSLLFYRALQDAGVTTAMSLYTTGRHGWGFRSSLPFHREMKLTLSNWLKTFE